MKQEKEFYRIRIQGKGRKERINYVDKNAIIPVLYTFQGKKWLFEKSTGEPYSRKAWYVRIRNLGRAFLGKDISPHVFRHSWAQHMLEEGVPIAYIAAWLGHSSVQTTFKQYVDAKPTWERFRKVLV
jgi:integrase/recombinase XerD